MQAAFGCFILLLYTCSQNGLDIVQLSLVVFFLRALAHLLICTNEYAQMQLALCGGGSCSILCAGSDCMWWWLYVVVVAVHSSDGNLYMCGSGGITV